jgi:branched-chain amino acid transport system ATP-binding protein
VAEHILRLKEEGMTILLSEQNLRFASRVSDRAYILEKGRIGFQGPTADLTATPEVLRRYLMV